jgi:hypothetical protein
MPFGVDIRFTPLTPGIQPRGAPLSPSPFPDLNSFKPITEEELANLRYVPLFTPNHICTDPSVDGIPQHCWTSLLRGTIQGRKLPVDRNQLLHS